MWNFKSIIASWLSRVSQNSPPTTLLKIIIDLSSVSFISVARLVQPDLLKTDEGIAMYFVGAAYSKGDLSGLPDWTSQSLWGVSVLSFQGLHPQKGSCLRTFTTETSHGREEAARLHEVLTLSCNIWTHKVLCEKPTLKGIALTRFHFSFFPWIGHGPITGSSLYISCIQTRLEASPHVLSFNTKKTENSRLLCLIWKLLLWVADFCDWEK